MATEWIFSYGDVGQRLHKKGNKRHGEGHEQQVKADKHPHEKSWMRWG